MARPRKKPADGPKNGQKPPAGEPSGTDSAKEYAKLITQTLVNAERAGELRWVIAGIGEAFQVGEASATDYRSEPAKRLSAGRRAAIAYFMSLLRTLDTHTRGELLNELITDAWIRASPDKLAQLKAAGMKVGGERNADLTVLGAMRWVTMAYCDLVNGGNERLASEMLYYVLSMVTTLDTVARNKPEWIKSGAAERVDWPIMVSLNYPKQSDFQKLAAQIGLASESPVRPQTNHTWKPNTPLNRYILEMLVQERWGDGRILTKANVRYYLDEVLMPLFVRVSEEEGGWENYPEFAPIARSAATRGKQGTIRSEIRSRVKKVLEAMACEAGDADVS